MIMGIPWEILTLGKLKGPNAPLIFWLQYIIVVVSY